MMFCYILKHNFFRGALGASWRPFWCLFGWPLASLWDVLGSLWPPLGTPWAHFGALGSLLGGPGGCLGLHLDPFGTTLVVLEGFLDATLVTLAHF